MKERNVFEKFDRMLEYLLGVMAAILVLVSMSAVIARYIFSSSLVWADEFLRYFFVWAIMLASPILLTKKRHIIVDFTGMIFPEKVRNGVVFVAISIVTFFITVMLIHSFSFVKSNMNQLSAAMELRMGYVYLCMPIGFFLMLLSCIRIGIEEWQNCSMRNKES